MLYADTENNNVLITGGTPQQFTLATNIESVSGINNMDGVRIVAHRVTATAYPVGAPGAAMNDTLWIGTLRESQQLTAAQMDPSNVNFREAYRWMILDNWQTPLIAAVAAYGFVQQARRTLRARRGVSFVGTTDVPWLVLGSQNVTQTWRINWVARTWFTLP